MSENSVDFALPNKSKFMPTVKNLKIFALILALIVFALLINTLSGSLSKYAGERQFGASARIALVAGGGLLSLFWLAIQIYTSFCVINRFKAKTNPPVQ